MPGAREIRAWPRTGRLLPWLLAAFLAMIYLVPFDDVQLPIPLPMESTLDRIVLPLFAVFWVAALLAGRSGTPRLRSNPLNPMLLLFIGLVGAGLLLHYGLIVERGELGLAVKRTTVLGGYLLFFYIAVSVLRADELRGFGRLLTGLGCLLAAGLIYQHITGANLFREFASHVFQFKLSPSSIVIPGDLDSAGRASIYGPTRHALVTASLLAVSLCFAALELDRARTLGRKFLYALAFGLIVAGGFATSRRSAAVLPVFALATFVLANPRALRQVLPVAALSVALAAVLVPSAMEAVISQLAPNQIEQNSSALTRFSDYAVVRPDIEANSALGRGYGTYEPLRYRLLDNQYLRLLVETGLFGLLAYIAMIVTMLGLALAARLRAGPHDGPPASALIAAGVALAVANALYDALYFPQIGYMLFFLAAMAVMAELSTRPQPEQAAAPISLRRRLAARVLHPVGSSALVTPLMRSRGQAGSGRGGGSPRRPA